MTHRLLQKVCEVLWVICRLLTNLLKKNAFKWNEEAEAAFQELKTTMTKIPVLALADLSNPFIIEIDACSKEIGVVLMQVRLIAYFSKALAPRHLAINL